MGLKKAIMSEACFWTYQVSRPGRRPVPRTSLGGAVLSARATQEMPAPAGDTQEEPLV